MKTKVKNAMRKLMHSTLPIMLLFLLPFCAWAQSRIITGKISDLDGQPLPGATIQLKGTSIGTITGVDGRYALEAEPSLQTMIISFVGMKTKEVNLENRNLIDVVLEADIQQLSEIVITGAGVPTEKRKLAFSVETLNSKEIPIVPTASIDQALVGQIPGAQISSIVGTPGSEISILLRGINSLNRGTMPMILVDGVQMGATLISSIDPASIEKVEVIQGAAAGSIYGAQGANGVIQFFTKKGTSGNIKVDFSASVGQNEFLNIGNLQKARLHGYTTNAFNEVINPADSTPLTQDPVTLLYNGNVGYAPLNPSTTFSKPYDQNLEYIDHFKVFLKPAHVYNSRIAVSGGTEKSDFTISVSKNRHESNFNGDGYNDRTNLNLNYGLKMRDNLQLRTSTQLIDNLNTIDLWEKQDFGYNGNTFSFLNTRPFADFNKKDADGNYGYYYGSAPGINYTNPLYRLAYTSTTDSKVDLLQNVTLSYNVNRNFEADISYGLNHQTRGVRYEVQNQSLNANSNATNRWIARNNRIDNTGEITQYDIDRTFHNFKATGHLNFDFTKDFGLRIPLQSSSMLVFDYRSDQLSRRQAYALGMPIVPPNSLALGTSFNIPEDYKEQFVTYGYLFNQRFEYNDLAGFSAGFRSDYSSAFGRGSKPFTFPRADGFFRVSSLNFWSQSGILQNILEWKIRAAYGEAGIQPRPFDRFVTLSSKSLGNSNSLYIGSNQSNPNLDVEVSKESEIGTDVSVDGFKYDWLKGFQLSFTHWWRGTNNSIFRVDAPPSVGVGSVLDNALSLNSKGIQASLLAQVHRSTIWSWDSKINFGTQESILTKVLTDSIIFGNRLLKSGDPVGQYYVRLMLKDVNQLGPDGNPFIEPSLQDQYEVASNGWVVNRSTKQPFITSNRHRMGNPNPDFIMNFIQDFSFRNFLTLSVQIDWVQGVDLYNNTRQWMYRDGIHSDYDKPITINGETGAWSAFYRGAYDFSNGWEKNYFIENASFVRLRNVAIGIDFAKMLRAEKLSKLQIILSGRNLLTKTNYTGMDPEVSSWDNESIFYGANTPLYRGMDDSSQPNFRTYQITLNIGI